MDIAKRILLLIVAIGFFMQSLDATILNTALPSIAHDLGVSPLKMQMVVISYMLTIAFLIPASGWLSDRLGTQKVFLFAIVVFSIGSLLCALSTSLWQLVTARVIQGVGGAFLLPVGRLVILRAFPRYELVQALSFVTIPGLVGPMVGPALGGWLVQYVSWHWIFLINLPVGILGFWATMKKMPNFKENAAIFDWIGFFLFGSSLLLISLGLQGLGEHMINVALSMCLLLAGVTMQITYWLRASKDASPLFSTQLFCIPTYAVGTFGNVFARIGSGSMPFLTPLFLQLVLDMSPAKTGLIMITSAVGAIMAKTMVARLLKSAGHRQVLVINTLLLGVMIASFSLVTKETHLWVLLIQLGIFGVINSIQFTAMNSLTLQDLDSKIASSGNSLFSVVLQISLSLGVAVSSVFLNLFNHYSVDTSFHLTYFIVGVLTLCAAAIFLQLHKPSKMGQTCSKYP